MKAPGKTPTDRQVEWLERMNRAGYFATWCDDWQKAATVITDYLDGSAGAPNTIATKRKAQKCNAS
jgi:hypothetical protein